MNIYKIKTLCKINKSFIFVSCESTEYTVKIALWISAKETLYHNDQPTVKKMFHVWLKINI